MIIEASPCLFYNTFVLWFNRYSQHEPSLRATNRYIGCKWCLHCLYPRSRPAIACLSPTANTNDITPKMFFVRGSLIFIRLQYLASNLNPAVFQVDSWMAVHTLYAAKNLLKAKNVGDEPTAKYYDCTELFDKVLIAHLVTGRLYIGFTVFHIHLGATYAVTVMDGWPM